MMAMRWLGTGVPLSLEELPVPQPRNREVLVRVRACGVCRTDLHLVDGELPSARCPVTPGHEIVGEVIETGRSATRFHRGERIGVPWLARTCGQCRYCREAHENLCENAAFTGHTVDGGYAQYAVADERFCHPIPAGYSDAEAAPLLCAGLIGYRAYRAAGDGVNLGLYGFGAAAHLLAQIACAEARSVFAFTRPGDLAAQEFARGLGASWAGGSDDTPPEPLDAAILFAPVGALIPAALAATRPGGRVICAGIHMSDIPSFPYRLLWSERSVTSIANLTRADGAQFMALAAQVKLNPAIEVLPLAAANEALARLRSGKLQGAAVLVP